MNKVAVTTTIHYPTEAIRRFAEMEDWTLVIVGDQRTPHSEYGNLGLYLSPAVQEKLCPKLSELIGWNRIQRRNIGFLYAWRELKADVIATVDDDNIPMPNWGKNVFVGQNTRMAHFHMESDCHVFDPLAVTDYRRLWHRGFPLPLLPLRRIVARGETVMAADIQADFWNGDPDVDAICRMEHGPLDCRFVLAPFPFTSTRISPFNSQNTFLSRNVIPEYFCFPGIGRQDDIWASYHVQAQGFLVAYGEASVVQRRNSHNLIQDMIDEWIGYKHNDSLTRDIFNGDKNAVLDRLPDQSRAAFECYRSEFS